MGYYRMILSGERFFSPVFQADRKLPDFDQTPIAKRPCIAAGPFCCMVPGIEPRTRGFSTLVSGWPFIVQIKTEGEAADRGPGDY